MVTSQNVEFQKIYDAFQPRIHRYLTRLVGSLEAEDLTQEVFAKVSRGLQGFRGASQLSTWIYRIATNTARDRLRSPSFRRVAPKSSAGDLIRAEQIETAERAGQAREKRASIDQELIRKEMNECIRDFVDNLPENYRAVLVLSEIEGLKNPEIAEVLGLSLHTVKVRLHRARTRLRKELEAHCTFYGTEQGELACDLKTAFEEP